MPVVVPVLSDLNAEECLVAAVLLHDQHEVFPEVEDRELWFEHTRSFLGAARAIHKRGDPMIATFVLYELRDDLDRITWGGLVGEPLLMDILSRRMLDIQAFMGVANARIVREWAIRRRTIREAEQAAVTAYNQRLSPTGWIQL